MYILERDFQKDVKNWLEKHDCVVYKTPAGLMTAGKFKYSVSSGFPDLIVFCNGSTILIELKTDKASSKLRKTQVNRFKQLKKVGIQVFVLRPRDWEKFKEHSLRANVVNGTLLELKTWEKDVEENGSEK